MRTSSARPTILVVLTFFLILSACDSSLIPGRSPSDSVEIPVQLAPGDTETYEFEIEVEAITQRGRFSVKMSPLPRLLEDDGIIVEQSWSRDGVEERGWPEGHDVDFDTVLVGQVAVVLTNQNQSEADFPLTVIITADEITVPAPNEDDMRVEIRTADSAAGS